MLSNKKKIEQSSTKVDSVIENNVEEVSIQSHLANQQLAYTSDLDISYVKWISENIEDEDVEPYVDKSSDLNNGFIGEALKAVKDAEYADFPADYVPTDTTKQQHSSSKLEVNIV